MSLKDKFKNLVAPLAAGLAVGTALGLTAPKEKSEPSKADKGGGPKIEQVSTHESIQKAKEYWEAKDGLPSTSFHESDSEVDDINIVPPPDENMGPAGHDIDIHARWRGQFHEAQNSGKIDQAHAISSQYGWMIPIPESSPLWTLSVNSPEFQKEYNKLNKTQREYYNVYLSFLSEGLGHLARMDSSTASHHDTADVTAWMQGRYVSVINDLLAADMPSGRVSREKLSQETSFRIADFQLMTKADQMLQTAMTAYQVVRETDQNADEVMEAFYNAATTLQDPVAGKKLLSQRTSSSGNSVRRIHKSHEGHGGGGR